MAKEKKEMSRLSVILMGEEWTGKSSAGNTMLGQSVFKVDSDTEHVTHHFGIIEGRNVTVVDTPGWISECYPDVPLKTLKQGHNSVSFMCQGFHILLLTIPISQDQNWNQKLVQRLSNALSLFNADIWKHTMLLFTRYDLLDSKGFEQYLEGNGQAFQSLVEKCEQRYHVLNNRKCNDRKQVRELMEKIEQIVQVNDGQLLQLVTSEQKVGTLREHEMDTLRHNEQSKMEEPIMGESCFRLEDYMFKSLRPEENEPQNPTELLRSKSDLSHPADMQDAALEYSYIQNVYTESRPNLCSESPAEINRGLSRSSSEHSDPEASPNKKNTCTEVEETCMGRDGDGDKEKNKKHIQHTTLQRDTPHTWDDLWDLNITCSFYNVVSNHQQTIVTCVLQISVCWRKIKPSCQTDWTSFTVYGDNWLFIMILYLFVTYLILIYKSYGVYKETGCQTMNTLDSGFVDHQQEPGKEIQGVFHSLLRHIVNNRPKSLDEEITKCSKMEHVEKIPQHSTRGNEEQMKQSEDEVLLQHIQKGEEEGEELHHGQKYIEDDELLQHICQSEDDNELPLHGKKDEEDEELLLHIHKDKEENKELPQPVYKHDENEELPQTIHNGEEEDEVLLQNIHKGEENEQLTQHSQKCRDDDEQQTQHDQKVEEDEELYQHIHKGEDDEQLTQHVQKGEEDEELHQHFYKGVEEHDEELLQHIYKGEDDEQLTQHGQKCRDDEQLTQHGQKGEEDEELPQHFYKGVEEHDEELLQHIHKGEEDEQLNQQGQKCRDDDEQLTQHGQKGEEDEELTQHGQKIEEDEALPQHFYKGVEEHDEELLKHIHKGEEDEQLTQHGQKCRDDDEELTQHICQGDEQLTQHFYKSAEEHDEELPYVHKYDKEDEEAFQPISQGDKDEQLIQHGQKCREDDEQLTQHGQKGKEDEELTQHGQKSEDYVLPQQFYKGVEEHDEELPYVEKYHKEDEEVFQNIRQGEEEEELPQHSQKAKGEELFQHIHKENEEDEDELPQHGETEQPQSSDKGEEEKSPKIKGVNEVISHLSKRGDKKEPPQQDYKEDDENMLQQKKRAVDDHTLKHSIKEEEKQMLQNNKIDYEVTDQPRNTDKGEEKLKLKRTRTMCRDGEWGHTKDINNNADTKVGEENPNQRQQVERRQQSPETKVPSSSRLNHKDAGEEDTRHYENIMRKRRRTKSLERFTAFTSAVEEDTKQHRDILKLRRTKSLERFDTFNNAGEEDTRHYENIMRKRRRTKSLERLTAFTSAGEEDTKQHRDILKLRRTKSLERFDTFNTE
ncbi:uncharacterized protein LOC132849058 isoform X3 [Tachysurus vachellii]|uniref:uncharacterized protein LOC132849058 isoform X3 n=1 Tax=Tachysurus vachellii TaxID=175792 RepID=UPI00296AA258|nr:uncharacterized protein LOC132849058 isoform X3 [Tachysurus vachellii]